MSGLVAKRTRVLAVLIVAVFALSAVQSMAFSGETITAASAAATEYEVKVGWLSDIINWNPMTLAMVEDWVACFLMYSALWQYDEKWDQPVGDLALSENYTYYPDGSMTLWINLTHNAYFRGSSNPDDTSMPLTAADVVYTFEMAASKSSTAWEYYLRDYENVTAVDDYTVRMDIPYSKATVIDDLTGIPIIPDGFYDGTIGLTDAMEPGECVGTGPFVYDSHLEGGWYKFATAPNYHGELDYGDERSVKIDLITYELSTNAGELVIKMNGGDLDVCVVTGEPDIFIDELGVGNSDITKEAVQELGICDIAINAVPLGFRIDAAGEGNDYCDGNYHLLDKEVRKAILMTLNKEYINTNIMRGLSVEADSVIAPGFWKKDIEGTLGFDTDAARQVLLDAGYVDNGGDFLVAGPTSYVVQEGLLPSGSELSHIRCHAPNTDPSYGFIVNAWAGWASEAGIGFDAEVVNEATMINEEWYKCMYDIWVWHWGWGPEPLSDLSVWLTDEITRGGDNCQGPMGEWWYWEDEVNDDAYSGFDENFTEAKETVNKYDRRDVIYDLQQFVYDSYCETPPYYDVGLYGYSTARYQGWGDWSENSGITIISGMPWLWFGLIPAGNMIPEIDPGLQSTYELGVSEVGTFDITVSDADGDSLWVNWTYGDGSPVNSTKFTSVNTLTVSTTHAYTAEGTYTLSVDVTDGQPFHTVTDTAEVVVGGTNLGPTLSGLVYSPSKAYVNEETSWSVTATDPDDPTMTLTFAWGDNTYTVRTLNPDPIGTAIPVTVTHTYTAQADYSVQISVWDGYDVPTNTIHNTSITRTYSVMSNTAPTAPTVASVETNEDIWTPISATTRDADPDTLRVTWDWGDGTYNVTNHDTSSSVGTTITSSVKHSWTDPDTYAFTVWVDDLTGFTGHNVSTLGSAIVNPEGTNLGPTSIALTQSPEPGYVDEAVTLTVSAFDPNGDALQFTVELGDDEIVVESTTGSDDVQTVEIEHTYTWADIFTVYVHADDGGINVTSSAFYVTVEERPENVPPEITMQNSYSAMYNETFTVTPAFVYDDDGDDLTVWYNWGDGSPITAGNPAAAYAGTHRYSVAETMTMTVSVDDGTGLVGHNVSTTSSVSINYNRRPTVKSIVKSPLTGPYEEGQEIVFNITVSDKEGNDVTVKVDFGDDTAVESATETLSGPDGNVTVRFSHSYASAEVYTVTIWVEDEYDHPDPTWITTTTTVTIVAADDDDDGGNILIIIAGAAILLIIVAAVVMMLMKKRKGKTSGGAGEGGMEGMMPPEDVPPPPGQ